MTDIVNKQLILGEIPLFGDLSAKEIQLLLERSSFVSYKKGQVIYHEGDPADAFYCLVSGRVAVFTKDRLGNETVVEYLHRGKYFGIISLLTAEAHSVTARALNDCTLLTIKKEDFDYILKKIPRLAIDLSQTLSRRLKNKDIHQKKIFESTIVSVFSSYSHAGKTVYALNLSLSLKKETSKSVIILDISQADKPHSLPKMLEIEKKQACLNLSSLGLESASKINEFINKSKFGIDLSCISYDPDDDSCVKKLVDVLSILVNDYHYIVLDLPAIMDKCIFNILNQSDLIHILTSPDEVDLKRTHNLIRKLESEYEFQKSKINVIINEYRFSKLNYQKQRQILESDILATLPKIELVADERLVLDNPSSEYAKAVRRISRNLGECSVGLVLGVGAAYGFCHIGVLKVIEEEKIPVDVICGASIGAIIAALWATGRSAKEILQITGEIKGPKYIWSLVDFTFPALGFIKGKKLYRFLKKYFQDMTFYDVKLPLKIVASDLEKKEPKIMDKGLLADALMASCSMPGVFRPFSFKDSILLDGGITTPLPTEPLIKMGINKIIAVNVTPSKDDIIHQLEDIKGRIDSTYKTVKKKGWFALGEYFKQKFKTNILEIIFNSVEILQSEVAQKESQFADVVLHPNLSGLHWLEFHRAAEFAKKGEEEARKNLERIRQMMKE